jgi:hypothetical protein
MGNGNDIQCYQLNGEFSHSVTLPISIGPFKYPRDMKVLDGMFYLIGNGAYSSAIREYKISNGTLVQKWGGNSNGNGDGKFYKPSTLTKGPNGCIYIADSSNHRIVSIYVEQ